jgi:hypothetical protein
LSTGTGLLCRVLTMCWFFSVTLLSGTELVFLEDANGVTDRKITRGILTRVFNNIPRHLQSDVKGALTFNDFVWLFLAEKVRRRLVCLCVS